MKNQKLTGSLPKEKKKRGISKNRVAPEKSRRRKIYIKYHNRFGQLARIRVVLPDVPREARKKEVPKKGKDKKEAICREKPTFLRAKIYRITGRHRVYFYQNGKKAFLTTGSAAERDAAACKQEEIESMRTLEGKRPRKLKLTLSEHEHAILQEEAFYRYLVRKKKRKRKAKRIRRGLENDQNI